MFDLIQMDDGHITILYITEGDNGLNVYHKLRKDYPSATVKVTSIKANEVIFVAKGDLS